MNHHTRLKYQFLLLQSIRNFFEQDSFLDVLTPPMVVNPGMEVHIHPFEVTSAVNQKSVQKYLHTSPEFHMKWLLSQGFEKIFQISYCFRDEPESVHHRPQFLMLEWYRVKERYEKIMEDIENLIQYSAKFLQDRKAPLKNHFKQNIKMEKYTIQDLFQEYLNIDILQYLEPFELRSLIEKNFKDVPLPPHNDRMLWEDYYFLLFLNKIETKLNERPFLLLYEFPHHLSALSTLKEEDPRVCERFEVYMDGIELCNCFNELTIFSEQKKRFQEQKTLKKKLYNYELPEPTPLWKAFEEGLPESSGVALGIERLLMSLTTITNPFFE